MYRRRTLSIFEAYDSWHKLNPRQRTIMDDSRDSASRDLTKRLVAYLIDDNGPKPQCESISVRMQEDHAEVHWSCCQGATNSRFDPCISIFVLLAKRNNWWIAPGIDLSQDHDWILRRANCFSDYRCTADRAFRDAVSFWTAAGRQHDSHDVFPRVHFYGACVVCGKNGNLYHYMCPRILNEFCKLAFGAWAVRTRLSPHTGGSDAHTVIMWYVSQLMIAMYRMYT